MSPLLWAKLRYLIISVIISIALLAFAVPTSASDAISLGGFPYFNILTVVKDQTVTIQAYNFPANDTFTVTMGRYGSLGVGGVIVGTTSTGNGGAFIASYTIPAQLAGSDQIAIRLQSATSGYYAYNWFYNNPVSSAPVQPGYSGYPYFYITSVVQDQTVTIQAYNFPANDQFTVRMGDYGTLGVGGVKVATLSSGSGGSFTATYDIPSLLTGSYRIAIRFESSTSGHYAYNWFYNNTATVPVNPPVPPSPSVSPPTYSGYPYFVIDSVIRDQTVTIDAYNFPPNDTFTLMMGPYGTLGIGGIVLGTVSTGDGGNFTETYTIPAQLAGSYQIAIRLQSNATGYFAYNWFYNNSTR